METLEQSAIWLKLTIKTPKRRDAISAVLVSLLLALNIFHTLF